MTYFAIVHSDIHCFDGHGRSLLNQAATGLQFRYSVYMKLLPIFMRRRVAFQMQHVILSFPQLLLHYLSAAYLHSVKTIPWRVLRVDTSL